MFVVIFDEILSFVYFQIELKMIYLQGLTLIVLFCI